MLTTELIRAEWMKRFCVGDGRATRATLTEEQAVENFARAIEQAARREAMKLALSKIACATSRSEAYKAIYALIEHETK